MAQYILSIDQGTTGTKVLVIDHVGDVVSESYRKHTQHYPKPSWVEHDAEEIWNMLCEAVTEALVSKGIDASEIVSIGLANQGETFIFFDEKSGKPMHHAIVWSCKRSTELSEQWAAIDGWPEKVTFKTGLRIDPYYSATKIKWAMEHEPAVRAALNDATLKCCTLDSWFIYRMTGSRSYVTDSSTASRTLLFNIRDNVWDQEILDFLGIQERWLPTVLPSVGEYGVTEPSAFCGIQAPIHVNMMDQAASLYGHLCTEPGMSKCTYGTGCFIYMNTGGMIHASDTIPIDTTVVWNREGQLTYCLDTSVPSAGSVIEWGMNTLGLYDNVAQLQEWSMDWLDEMNESPESFMEKAVLFIPSFSGLGTPHWDANVRGTYLKLTHSSGKREMARAILEGVAYSVADCLETIRSTQSTPISVLRVDGGPTKNPYLMQFQANIAGVPVEVQMNSNTTSIGLGYLAGETLSWWSSEQLRSNAQIKARYEPQFDESLRLRLRKQWNAAIHHLRQAHQDWLL